MPALARPLAPTLRPTTDDSTRLGSRSRGRGANGGHSWGMFVFVRGQPPQNERFPACFPGFQPPATTGTLKTRRTHLGVFFDGSFDLRAHNCGTSVQSWPQEQASGGQKAPERSSRTTPAASSVMGLEPTTGRPEGLRLRPTCDLTGEESESASASLLQGFKGEEKGNATILGGVPAKNAHVLCGLPVFLLFSGPCLGQGVERIGELKDPDE